MVNTTIRRASMIGTGFAVAVAAVLALGIAGSSDAAAERSDAAKIVNAHSAAPEAVARDSKVLDWSAKEGGPYRLLRSGSNGWTCFPDYPSTPGNDPWCLDRTSMTWLDAYMAGKEPKLAQPGLSYMLQGGSDASATDPLATKPAPGEAWLSAPPHLMLFSAGRLDPQAYGTDHHSGRPYVMWSGTPYEHLMLPVR